MKPRTKMLLTIGTITLVIFVGLGYWAKAEYKAGYGMCAAHRALVLTHFLPQVAQAERDDPALVPQLKKEQQRWIEEVRFQTQLPKLRRTFSAKGCEDGLVQLGQ